MPPVQGENKEGQSSLRANTQSSFLASSCQLPGSENTGVGGTQLCAVRKVISLKRPINLCAVSKWGYIVSLLPLNRFLPRTTSPNQVDTREKGLRLYGATAVLKKWTELMGFATFSAKSQEHGTIKLKSIPHLWKDFHEYSFQANESFKKTFYFGGVDANSTASVDRAGCLASDWIGSS